MAELGMKAASTLIEKGVDVEMIDIRTLKPLDKNLLISSAKKTGRVVVVDGGWRSFGAAAEISALIFEEAFNSLKTPVVRVTLPDTPAPASSVLEKVYYPTVESIIEAVQKVMNY
jgi:pyruvate dehydrogenase E1 component beta subunit